MKTKVKRKDWKVKEKRGKYSLQVNGQTLTTPQGHVIESKSLALMNNIVRDLHRSEDVIVEDGIVLEPMNINAYFLASYKKDIIEKNPDSAKKKILKCLKEDSLFQLIEPSPPLMMYQKIQQKPADRFFEPFGIKILEHAGDFTEKEFKLISKAIKNEIDTLTLFQLSSLNIMAFTHDQIVMTLLFLTGRCSKKAWARAVFSRSENVIWIVEKDYSDAHEEENEAKIKGILALYEKDCFVVTSYLKATKCDAQFCRH